MANAQDPSKPRLKPGSGTGTGTGTGTGAGTGTGTDTGIDTGTSTGTGTGSGGGVTPQNSIKPPQRAAGVAVAAAVGGAIVGSGMHH
jgi:penicillin G amidase